MGFLGNFFSFFRRKSQPELVEGQLEERRLRPRINPKEETRVLVIDDSPTILTAMKRFLESAHCVFLGALDAKMGMEVALTQKPDMIFLDIVMPGINGFAALRALRKNARTRDIPIIMMSGNEQAKAQFFGAHIGADDFMKKPFSRFEVFARIANLLDDERIPRRPPAATQEQAPLQEQAQPASQEQEQPPRQHDNPPALAVVTPEPESGPDKQAPQAESPPPLAVADTPTKADSEDAPAAEAPAAEPAEPTVSTVKKPKKASAKAIPKPTPVAPVVVPEQLAHIEAPQPVPATPAHAVSAQVLPIAPITMPTPLPVVPQELLARIARLAQLAQSDPEALKALVILSAQLTSQFTAAEATTTQARATAM